MKLPPLLALNYKLVRAFGEVAPIIEPGLAAALRSVPRALVTEGLAERLAKGKVFRPLTEAEMAMTAEEVAADAMAKLKREYVGKVLRSYFNDETYGAARRAAAYLGAGWVTANLLGYDPYGVVTAANAAAQAGLHYFVGRTLLGSKGAIKWLGVGYWALAAYNLLKEGDQPGPF